MFDVLATNLMFTEQLFFSQNFYTFWMKMS